jgi:hypothetical protein
VPSHTYASTSAQMLHCDSQSYTNRNPDQLHRMLYFRHPVNGFGSGSGLRSAISMYLSIGESSRGTIFVRLINLKPKYSAKMIGMFMYEDTKVSVSQL